MEKAPPAGRRRLPARRNQLVGPDAVGIRPRGRRRSHPRIGRIPALPCSVLRRLRLLRRMLLRRRGWWGRRDRRSLRGSRRGLLWRLLWGPALLLRPLLLSGVRPIRHVERSGVARGSWRRAEALRRRRRLRHLGRLRLGRRAVRCGHVVDGRPRGQRGGCRGERRFGRSRLVVLVLRSGPAQFLAQGVVAVTHDVKYQPRTVATGLALLDGRGSANIRSTAAAGAFDGRGRLRRSPGASRFGKGTATWALHSGMRLRSDPPASAGTRR